MLDNTSIGILSFSCSPHIDVCVDSCSFSPLSRVLDNANSSLVTSLFLVFFSLARSFPFRLFVLEAPHVSHVSLI